MILLSFWIHRNTKNTSTCTHRTPDEHYLNRILSSIGWIRRPKRWQLVSNISTGKINGHLAATGIRYVGSTLTLQSLQSLRVELVRTKREGKFTGEEKKLEQNLSKLAKTSRELNRDGPWLTRSRCQNFKLSQKCIWNVKPHRYSRRYSRRFTHALIICHFGAALHISNFDWEFNPGLE
jgi:hypothetical protein